MRRDRRRRLRRSSGARYVNLGTALVSGSYGRNYAHHRAFRTEIAVADEGYIYETCMRSGTFMVEWLTREVLRTEPGKQKEMIAALEAKRRRARSAPTASSWCPIGKAA
jgi:xylulokinase